MLGAGKRGVGSLLGLPPDLRRFEACTDRCFTDGLRPLPEGQDGRGEDAISSTAPPQPLPKQKPRPRHKRSLLTGFLHLADYISCSRLALTPSPTVRWLAMRRRL